MYLIFSLLVFSHLSYLLSQTQIIISGKKNLQWVITIRINPQLATLLPKVSRIFLISTVLNFSRFCFSRFDKDLVVGLEQAILRRIMQRMRIRRQGILRKGTLHSSLLMAILPRVAILRSISSRRLSNKNRAVACWKAGMCRYVCYCVFCWV